MAQLAVGASMGAEGGGMSALWTIVVLAFVLAVLAVVAFGLLKVISFARHDDEFRDGRTGRRRWESPHLETWDEFERTHDGKSPHLETHEEFERTHPA
jgi:hypothetical protein